MQAKTPADQQLTRIEHAGLTLPITPQDVEKIEAIINATGMTILDAPRVMQMYQMSAAVVALKAMFTDEMMAPIMELQNQRLGFLTDKDPAKAKQGQQVKPYDTPIVRNCLIEALIRGVRPVGNEFNIIAGNCYVTVAGFDRLVREWENLTDLELIPGAPQFGQGSAAVPYIVNYKINGEPQGLQFIKTTAIDRRIVVRVNAGMGADAVLGKAQRKALAATYKLLTGRFQPEGEIEPDGQTIEGVAFREVAQPDDDKPPVTPGAQMELPVDDQTATPPKSTSPATNIDITPGKYSREATFYAQTIGRASTDLGVDNLIARVIANTSGTYSAADKEWLITVADARRIEIAQGTPPQ